MNRSQIIRYRNVLLDSRHEYPGVRPAPRRPAHSGGWPGGFRAFEAALAAAGGSRPVWLILMSVKQGTDPGQSWLADQIGIRGATLTHHLAGMEERGLVTREGSDQRGPAQPARAPHRQAAKRSSTGFGRSRRPLTPCSGVILPTWRPPP